MLSQLALRVFSFYTLVKPTLQATLRFGLDLRVYEKRIKSGLALALMPASRREAASSLVKPGGQRRIVPAQPRQQGTGVAAGGHFFCSALI